MSSGNPAFVKKRDMETTCNPYRSLLILSGISAALFTGMICAAFSVPQLKGLLPAGIAGLAVSLILFFAFLKMFSVVNDFLAGQTAAARWEYSPDEWRQFAAAENARQKAGEGFFKANLIFIIIILIAAMIAVYFRYYLLLPVLIIGTVFVSYQDRARFRLSNIRVGKPDDVPLALLSTEGVWINKQFISFAGRTYFKASYESGENACLRFDWQTSERSGKTRSTYAHLLRVPIPQNQEAEADRVLSMFGAKK